ncbi:hypothetical protein DPX16_9466 [Anabarilius grahami]|uniref:Uncharacterized protein n=1 Tax=Anabarilius grahami TaxID=495550 RepID=A0A3N0Z5P9_ANAGA|nr:hypothetical protein DPX16_9466 [Anabarilius grahami]
MRAVCSGPETREHRADHIRESAQTTKVQQLRGEGKYGRYSSRHLTAKRVSWESCCKIDKRGSANQSRPCGSDVSRVSLRPLMPQRRLHDRRPHVFAPVMSDNYSDKS